MEMTIVFITTLVGYSVLRKTKDRAIVTITINIASIRISIASVVTARASVVTVIASAIIAVACAVRLFEA